VIKIIIDTSDATNEEIEALEDLVPLENKKHYFNKNNIFVDTITKNDIAIANANNTTIKSGLKKEVILGCVPRDIANNKKDKVEYSTRYGGIFHWVYLKMKKLLV